MGAARLIHSKQLGKMFPPDCVCVCALFKQIFFMSDRIQQPQGDTPLSCKPEVLFRWLVLEDSLWGTRGSAKGTGYLFPVGIIMAN